MDKGERVRAISYGQYVTVRVPDKIGLFDDDRIVRLGVDQHGIDKQVALLLPREARALARAILALTEGDDDDE